MGDPLRTYGRSDQPKHRKVSRRKSRQNDRYAFATLFLNFLLWTIIQVHKTTIKVSI